MQAGLLSSFPWLSGEMQFATLLAGLNAVLVQI